MPPAEVKNATVFSPSLQHPVELLWNLIIRPPRSRYSTEQLGPVHFRTGRRTFVRRTDVELRNPRGHILRGSFFEPLPVQAWEASRRAAEGGGGCGEAGAGTAAEGTEEPRGPLPCIVFLHGNSSCRLEAVPLVTQLMPLWISLFCFDFSGCGLSEGQYISLGWFERDDLATCIEYLRSSGRVSRIALWGRSMGAFTALLHADRDPTIAGLVLDSPFTSLKVLAEELARSYAKVPSWMVRAVLIPVRSIIQSKAGFDIEHLDALEHVSHSFSPALFVAAHGDDFIRPDHARRLHEAYQGEKELHMIDGDHNSARPEACRKKSILFLSRAFHCERLDQLLAMHTSGLYDIFSGSQHLAGHDSNGAGEDGVALCQQMQIFPALRMMMLVRQRHCRRPFSARTVIKLLEEQSEAGFFVSLEPAAAAGGTACGLPRLLVLTVSTGALIASRICDDALETVAVAAGLPPRQAQPLVLSIDRDGHLRLQLGESPPLEFECGTSFREEVTVWLMLLHGQTSFGALTVDDAEATLRENLGDVVLRQRHLGSGTASQPPAPLPRGDSGRSWSESPRGPPPLPMGLESDEEAAEGSDGEACAGSTPLSAECAGDGRLAVMTECAQHPEALIGWRLYVHTVGEGVVVGVRHRWGRSTQHLISGLEDGHSGALLPARCAGMPCAVVLCRKESQVRRHRGLAFDLLRKEF